MMQKLKIDRKFVPMLVIWLVIAAWAPRPMDSIAMTAITPIMIPSIVKPARSLFALMLESEIRKLSMKFIVHIPSLIHN